jgi:valine--pyruvate aminotransferase
MKFSKFGEKLTSDSGILELMDDLGKALASSEKKILLGGGNPAHIPEIEKIYREQMEHILKDGDRFERVVGNYSSPEGDGKFIKEFAGMLKNNFGWKVSEKNICVLGGSQTSFFFLFNLLAGKYSDGSFKKILLPIVPEYIGYEDQGLQEDYFVSFKPKFNIIDDHTFKYQIDFDSLKVADDVAGICVSRPTNPTANVVTDEEVEKLISLAENSKIPLIIDSAYGAPFPNILFSDVKPYWNENIINVFSFSKIGMPGARTSVVLANEEIIKALASINAIISLAPSNLGQHLILDLLKENKLLEISNKIIKPFYQKRSEEVVGYFHSVMDPKLPYYLHKSEGAFFLWLWCKDLPIDSYELYKRLKAKGVIVVPGNYFFAGQKEDWKHKKECLRISYCQDIELVKEGFRIIAETVKEAYSVK